VAQQYRLASIDLLKKLYKSASSLYLIKQNKTYILAIVFENTYFLKLLGEKT